MQCDTCGEQKTNGFNLAVTPNRTESTAVLINRWICTECFIEGFDRTFQIKKGGIKSE